LAWQQLEKGKATSERRDNISLASDAARSIVSDPTASDGFKHIVKIRYIIRSVAMQMRDRQPAAWLRVVHALKTVS
jgi:hypothetical protein